MRYQYRYFRYLPNLHDPSDYCDFAIAIATEQELSLIGVSLSEYGHRSDHPLQQFVIESSFKAAGNRIRNLLDYRNPASGYEALAELNNAAATNVAVSPIEEIESDLSIYDQAVSLFSKVKEVVDEYRSHRNFGRWQSGPQTLTFEVPHDTQTLLT